MKCKIDPKDIDVSRSSCFRCIRNTKYSEKYDFVYECSHDIMKKMSFDEVNELAKDVLDAIRENFSEEAEFDELRLLGDCFARVFMYTLTRGHYYRGAYDNLHSVREVLYIAADKSLPACCIVNMYGESLHFPLCWIEKHLSLRVS